MHGLLAYLELLQHMKPSGSVKNVLSAAARISFGSGPDVERFVGDLEPGVYALPSPKRVKRYRLKRDLMSMRFEQRFFLRDRSLIYITPLTHPLSWGTRSYACWLMSSATRMSARCLS